MRVDDSKESKTISFAIVSYTTPTIQKNVHTSTRMILILLILFYFVSIVGATSYDEIQNGDFSYGISNWTTTLSSVYYNVSNQDFHVNNYKVWTGSSWSYPSLSKKYLYSCFINGTPNTIKFKFKNIYGATGDQFSLELRVFTTPNTYTFIKIWNSTSVSSAYSDVEINLNEVWSEYLNSKNESTQLMFCFSRNSGEQREYYIDDVETISSDIPDLPESDGIIYFQYDPYSVDSTMNVRYNECFDYNNTGYHWFGILQPLYYYNEYSVLKIDSGVYENSSYTAIDDILYQRLDPEGNCWDEYTKTLTSNDYGVLRSQLIIKKDYYYGIRGLYMKYISSSESVYDTDYAYHNNFIGNSSATAPVSTTTNDTVDEVPDISTMIDASDETLPDTFDSDEDSIQDVTDTDDDNNNMNDSIDSDNDNLPDSVDSEDTNPQNDGTTTDSDIDQDGVSDETDNDIDGDGLLNEDDPDDNGNGIPDNLESPGNTTYNSTVISPDSGSNTTLNSTYLTGYYDSVDSFGQGLSDSVNSVLNFVLYPITYANSFLGNLSSVSSSYFGSAVSDISSVADWMSIPITAFPPELILVGAISIIGSIILFYMGVH